MNINDVAEAAGVSRGSVSNYLNNKKVSDKIKLKIEAAIKELNYIPNSSARDLRSKESKFVVFIIPTVWSPFFSELTYYIQNELNSSGYKMILCISDSDFNKEKETISSGALEQTKKSEENSGKEVDIGNVVANLKDFLKEEKTINSFSKIIDAAIKELVDKDKISSNVSKMVKEGKNAVVEKIKEKIDHELDGQIVYVEELKEQTEKWKNYYQEKDIKNMKAVSKKIDSLMKDIMPIDTILTEAKQIQNLQQLIENNNNQFDLSSTQLELAKMLA